MNLATNPGIASLLIGTGTRTGNDPNLTMAAILSNRTGFILNVGSVGCLGGYSPLAGDGRLLSVHVNDPAQLGGANLKGVTSVVVGGHSACAIKSDTTVWCWGLMDMAIMRPEMRLMILPMLFRHWVWQVQEL